MNHIPVTHHSDLFSDDVIAASAREIIRAQGYGNVRRAETQREAEALAVAALESAHAAMNTKSFTPDWDLLEGANKSLREHMAVAKAARESEQRFREQVAAALKELRAELVADANAMATHGSGTSSCTIEDAFDATIAALLGGTEEK